MMHPQQLFATALIACLPYACFSQTLAWGPVIDCAPENAGALRPRVVVNADGHPVVLWARSSTLGAFVAVGNDAGFWPPLRINPENVDLAAADWQGPALAAFGDTVMAVFKALPEATAPCYLVSSVDGGQTWSDTLRVDPYDGLVSRFPSVAVTATGAPIVEYMQFTSGYLEPRHVVRTWMGGTFMPPVQVSAPFAPGEVCDCCTAEVGCSGAGVVALYRNAGGNIRTIWGASSVNGGMSFPTGAQVDATNWSLAACPSSGPDLYFAGDSVRYVWMSGEDNGIKVFMGSAHAATLSTGPQANVHPGQMTSLQQNFPRIAGQGDTLGIVWEQLSAGQREVLFAYSTSGLGGLGVPDTVNLTLSGAQETPDLAYDSGAFHIVWSEPANGQVRYRRAQLIDDTGIDAPRPLEMMRLRYDALDARVYITGITARSVELLDGAGRALRAISGPVNTIPVEDLAPGCYLVRALDEEGGAHAGRVVKE